VVNDLHPHPGLPLREEAMTEAALIKQLEKEAAKMEREHRHKEAIQAFMELSRWSGYSYDNGSKQRYYNRALDNYFKLTYRPELKALIEELGEGK